MLKQNVLKYNFLQRSKMLFLSKSWSKMFWNIISYKEAKCFFARKYAFKKILCNNCWILKSRILRFCWCNNYGIELLFFFILLRINYAFSFFSNFTIISMQQLLNSQKQNLSFCWCNNYGLSYFFLLLPRIHLNWSSFFIQN